MSNAASATVRRLRWPEGQNSERRKRQRQRIWPAMQRQEIGFHTTAVPLTAAAVATASALQGTAVVWKPISCRCMAGHIRWN